MRTLGTVLVRAVVLVALGAGLTACNDDADPSPEPTSSGTPTSPSVSPTESTTDSPTDTPTETPTDSATDSAALCTAVSTEDLASLGGRPFTDATAGGADDATECNSTSEDLSIAVAWQSRPGAGSLDDEVEQATSPGLQRSPVTVAGQDGALLTGDVTGQRVARVVVVVGGQSLVVLVAYLEGVGPEANAETVQGLALGVAERAAAALG